MTYDQAMTALRERAPMATFEEMAAITLDQHPSCKREEEVAYHFAKWVKKNGTDEELAALGMRR